MAERKSLVLINGRVSELPDGDTLYGAGGGGGGDLLVPITDPPQGLFTMPGMPTGYATPGTTQTLGLSSMVFAAPIFIPGDATLSSIWFYVNSAVASSNAEVAMYKADGNGGTPGTKITASGDIATTSTGAKSFSASNEALTRGWYWLLIQCDTSTVQFRAMNETDPSILAWGGLYGDKQLDGSSIGLMLLTVNYAGSWPADGGDFNWSPSSNHNPIWLGAFVAGPTVY